MAMHDANRRFWEYCAKTYPAYFMRPSKVLEAGSLNVNGSVRHYFDVDSYVGLDWREGPGVDKVCFAHEMEFPYLFDTIASASMLEHDPFWDRSIHALVKHLAPDGILVMTWGAMKNVPHCFAASPDDRFHALAPKKVLDTLDSLGVYVHEFFYETRFGGGDGEVGLISFKNPEKTEGPRSIDELLEVDNT